MGVRHNKLVLLAVVVHCVDMTTWKNLSRLIALRRITGLNSGGNMASHLLKVAQEYDVTDKLGFFTFHTLLSACQPTVTNDEVKACRIRCFGHVLNLAAKAFLFGKNSDAFGRRRIEDSRP